MFALSGLLADAVTLKWDDQMWAFGPTIMVYLIVVVVVGLVTESLLGWHLPLGMIGAMLSALVRTETLTNGLIITGLGISSSLASPAPCSTRREFPGRPLVTLDIPAVAPPASCFSSTEL